MKAELTSLLRTADAWLAEGRQVVLATVIETWGSAPQPVGAKLVVDADGRFEGSVSGGCVEGAVVQEAKAAIERGTVKVLTFGVSDETAWGVGLACGGTIRVLVEPLKHDGAGMKASDLSAVLSALERREPIVRVVDLTDGNIRLVRRDDVSDDPFAQPLAEAFRSGRSRTVETGSGNIFVDVYMPPLRLVLLGAVHIAQALIPMALRTGYAVTVIDPRTAFASRERFPEVTLDTRWPSEALADLRLDPRTAFCALTHDPKIDEPGLIAALASDAFYIGALGSRRTHAKRCERLRAAGVSDDALSRIHAPIGLDIGAVGAPEIAVSIIAEITQTLRRREASGGRTETAAAIVLAAGSSTRMGTRFKLTEPVAGTTMVRRVVEAALASKARPVIVVTGHRSADVKTALAGLDVTFVHNPNYEHGLSTSLRAGLEALGAGCDAALIMLGDMPNVSAAIVDRLIDAFDAGEANTVYVPTVDGKRGNPVLWGAPFFKRLRELTGDTGGKPLLGEFASQVVEVAIDDPAILFDVDTEEALAAARSV